MERRDTLECLWASASFHPPLTLLHEPPPINPDMVKGRYDLHVYRFGYPISLSRRHCDHRRVDIGLTPIGDEDTALISFTPYPPKSDLLMYPVRDVPPGEILETTVFPQGWAYKGTAAPFTKTVMVYAVFLGDP